MDGRGDFSGDVSPCVLWCCTPADFAEYFCDCSEDCARVPEPDEWRALVRAFERWQDRGGQSDIMQTLKAAWDAEQARQLDQEGGSK